VVTETRPDASFPRRYAATQRFTLGEPRTITVSPDGRRVVFARSRGGDDPVNRLWVMDATTGEERLVLDPHALGAADLADLPPQERARRERAREGAGGVVGFATDSEATMAVTALGGELVVANLLAGTARTLATPSPVFDPRPDPAGTRVAYVSGPSLAMTGLDGSYRMLLDGSATGDTVSWGSAEFIAAEEMDRQRGFWWSPDGRHLAVCRVDVAPVAVWWIADPARPEQAPVAHRYPAAGTANALVTLHVLEVDRPAPVDGSQTVTVAIDHDRWPYIAQVCWTSARELLVTVQSRDQRHLAVLSADPRTGATSVVATDDDPDWVELVPGVPGRLADGRLVRVGDRDGVRRLLVDDVAVTPVDLQVRSVVAVGGDTVILHANPIDAPETSELWQWHAVQGLEPLVQGSGVHTATAGGGTLVVRSSTLDAHGARFTVLGGPSLASHAEPPTVHPAPRLHRVTPDRLSTAVLLPRDHDGRRLPVLMDPYGGPHAQRVVASRAAYLTSQWFADQGFAVVVVDGRGTPGRGAAWERAVKGDLATAVLDDQVRALHALADEFDVLDLSRVAIRGWSFGGYLAALAVLDRPDVFHAAIAGAPVTEWRWYDTHYTERYLGHPDHDADAYDRSSLIPRAPRLERPLLLIHGLADDNVVAAHTLQLSSALLAAGRPHEVLPLSGVSHMTPQEVVAENLLRHQLAFLRRVLG